MTQRAMKRIALLTSGGDAPGMNAAVRAAVRQGRALGLEVLGIQYGLRGVLENEPRLMDVADVGGILERGGTILMTSRYKPFLQPEVQQRAVERLREWGVEGLVVIGGEGSFHAAVRLHQLGMPTVGVPATIDNDIYGTDMAIGVDTALNTILQALDRLRDTATSHTRAFVVEVMGRHCGYLTLLAGVAGGAEAVLIPERPYDLDQLAALILHGYERGKRHAI
ncbi:MAG TPA: ATP-dependent 6-phosphofructokinase, partial [Candidatus Bipolaricaulota bacterium]